MRFSIVVPLYNKQSFIAETLRSVLEQTFADFEVIVVDDGSTDAGAAVVSAMDDTRIRYVRQDNAGVSVARNEGIRLALGEWVAFLDADDRLHPNYLASQDRAIRRHPDSSFVATGYRTVPAEEWDARIQDWPPTGSGEDFELIDDLPTRWMKSSTFMTSCVAIRRSLLDDLTPCFAVGESAGEDLDLFFRAAERSVIVFNPAPLHAYRAVNAGGLSAMARPQDEPPFLSRLENRARSGSANQAARSAIRFVQEIRISNARALLAAGGRLEALRMLWRSRSAATRHRWWTTAAMSILLPAALADSLHQRRLQRKQHR